MEDLGRAVARVAGSLETQRTSTALSAKIDPIRSLEVLPAPFVIAIDRRISDGVVASWETMGDHGPGSPTLRRALTNDEQNKLMGRVVDMRRALEPLEETSKDGRLLKLVSKMLGGFTINQRHDQHTAALMAIEYLNVVKNCPPWAIAEACDRVRTNRAHLTPAYCPNEPQFRAVVDMLTRPYRDRLAKLDELLNAPVRLAPPAEERPTREELEAKLGRPIGDGRNPVPAGAYTPEQLAAIEADHKLRQQRVINELAADDAKSKEGSHGDQA